MTRGRDVFWGALAAIAPIIFTIGTGYVERLGENYISRTFDVWPIFVLSAFINILYGLVVATLAVRFGGKQQVEISCFPVIGMIIGWVYSTCNVILFFMVYGGVQTNVGSRIIIYSGNRGFFFAAFYSVLLILYWKRYYMITKEDFSEKSE